MKSTEGFDGTDEAADRLRNLDYIPTAQAPGDNRIREMESDLARTVLNDIATRAHMYPGLRPHRFDKSSFDGHPILYWAADIKSCFAFYMAVERRPNVHETRLRVKVRLWHEARNGDRTTLIDTWMTEDGDGADPAVYADMILGAVVRHGFTTGFGTGRPVISKFFIWNVAPAECMICGEGETARYCAVADEDITLCDACGADHAADGHEIKRITTGG